VDRFDDRVQVGAARDRLRDVFGAHELGSLGKSGSCGKVGVRSTMYAGVLRQGRDVLAYFNNDGAGHAVRNARTLRALLGA
jgi:hypothetical protein